MSLLKNVYLKNLEDNARNIKLWESYINSLQNLDFKVFQEKLKVPILVPVGSRILFRGHLKHTNEVIASLGADYFVKCSLQQADVLRQHRIKDAQTKLDALYKEKSYFDNQICYKNQNIFENDGQEILEVYSEEEDRIWRKKHRENVRREKQSKTTEPKLPLKETITDEELWTRLEELELQEELEEEYLATRENNDDEVHTERVTFMKVENLLPQIPEESADYITQSEEFNEAVVSKTLTPPHETSKLQLLQQVIDKQNELKDKLFELKNKDRSSSKTEQDLISKLDEMDELDELEDEMDRLENVIENEEIIIEQKSVPTKQNRNVSFAHDEDDSETLELTFKHSDTEPCKEPYDPHKGITKPSDVYLAFPQQFKSETISILKKSKYKDVLPDLVDVKINDKEPISKPPRNNQDRTIVVKDVVEKDDCDNKQSVVQSRPVSIFKKTRQLKKM